MQFGEMSLRQLRDERVTLAGQLYPDHPGVLRIDTAADQPSHLCTVYQFHRAVMTQQQVISNVAYGRRPVTRMSFDRYQELVLNLGDPGFARLALAPMLETAQARPERQQMLEVLTSWLGQAAPPPLGRYARSYPLHATVCMPQPTLPPAAVLLIAIRCSVRARPSRTD